jgi:hypothetical protein
MDPVEVSAKVTEILRANPEGISRAGLLAWARLRVAPDLTDEQLDSALAALGPAVTVEGGFVRLTETIDRSPWAAPVAPAASPPTAPATSPAPSVRAQADGAMPTPAAGMGPVDQSPRGTGSAAEAWASDIAASETSRFSSVALLDGGESATAPAWTPGSRPSRPILALMPVIAVIVVGLVALTGLGASAGPTLGPTIAPGAPGSSIVGADSLEVGSCIVFPTASTFSDIETRPCDTAHDAEIVSVWEYPKQPTYPTDAEWQAQADPACRAALESYTGRSSDELSELTYGWFVPAEDAWGAGSRTVQCYLAAADGSALDHSYRGA